MGDVNFYLGQEGVCQKILYVVWGGILKNFPPLKISSVPSPPPTPHPPAVYIMNAAYTLHVLIKHSGNGAHRR